MIFRRPDIYGSFRFFFWGGGGGWWLFHFYNTVLWKDYVKLNTIITKCHYLQVCTQHLFSVAYNAILRLLSKYRYKRNYFKSQVKFLIVISISFVNTVNNISRKIACVLLKFIVSFHFFLVAYLQNFFKIIESFILYLSKEFQVICF